MVDSGVRRAGPRHEYRLVSQWRVPGTIDEVIEIIADPEDLVRWWPSVYIHVHTVERGDHRGVGQVLDLHTMGWLPYKLCWRLTVTEVTDTYRTFAARGDLDGGGSGEISQDGDYVRVVFRWLVRTQKPLLRLSAPLLRAVFEANHNWAMSQGERSLRLEIARRRAARAAESVNIPPPPPLSPASRILISLSRLLAPSRR